MGQSVIQPQRSSTNHYNQKEQLKVKRKKTGLKEF